MIKFIHTADLHLGKSFHEQSLIDDQSAMLNALESILKDDSYAALVISGDIYDRSIPSPEAINLFGSFLNAVKSRRPLLDIVVIPGNHDSAARLGFGRELFANLKLHFAAEPMHCDKPVIIEHNKKKCAFFLLPFLQPGSLNNLEDEFLRSQSELVLEASKRLENARLELAKNGVALSVLAAHLFAAECAESGSERVFLGNAEKIDISLFNNFNYIALGHLHRCQSAAKNAWYSGSPLAYSFDESNQEKYFLSVELDEDYVNVDKIPITPLHQVTRLSGPFTRFTGDISGDKEILKAKDDYLEIRLTDRNINENARERLRLVFPRLLYLRQDDALAQISSGAPGVSGERLDISADFEKFLVKLYGEADRDKIDFFNRMLLESEQSE
jgi:exonuclease SbcD